MAVRPARLWITCHKPRSPRFDFSKCKEDIHFWFSELEIGYLILFCSYGLKAQVGSFKSVSSSWGNRDSRTCKALSAPGSSFLVPISSAARAI